MVPSLDLMKAIDVLDYRVTTGDVASQSGLDIKQTERGLLDLASQAKGHLQVSETGEIVFLFPKNYRAVLRNSSLRLRLREWWQKVWKVLFYLIRISFGIILILSIVVISLAIIFLMAAMNRGSDDNDSGSGSANFSFFPSFLMRGMMYDMFRMDYYQRRQSSYSLGYRDAPSRSSRSNRRKDENSMNFLESVFSFLFGDGDPNADLEERRWQYVAGVIRNNGGAIAAEQVLPYLDLEAEVDLDDEDYMLPVLTQFNGRPEVSPEGNIIYHFPELQVMAEERGKQSVPETLREKPWKFSEAGSTQLTWAGGLGAVNFVLAVILGTMLADPSLQVADPFLYLGGQIGIVDIGYGVLLAYAIAFLAIPSIRFIWVSRKNKSIEQSNEKRTLQSNRLNSPSETIQQKIGYAKQFAAETVVSPEDLTYTTETGLTEQEALRSDSIDEEWRKRIEGLR
ncbi:MAG: hypothetical protein WBA57_20735 [Elainellaceae cyanobacterium]